MTEEREYRPQSQRFDANTISELTREDLEQKLLELQSQLDVLHAPNPTVTEGVVSNNNSSTVCGIEHELRAVTLAEDDTQDKGEKIEKIGECNEANEGSIDNRTETKTGASLSEQEIQNLLVYQKNYQSMMMDFEKDKKALQAEMNFDKEIIRKLRVELKMQNEKMQLMKKELDEAVETEKFYAIKLAHYEDAEKKIPEPKCPYCGSTEHHEDVCPIWKELEPPTYLPRSKEELEELSEMMTYITDREAISRSRAKQLDELVKDIEDRLSRQMNQDIRLEIFGSNRNGFGTEGADIDLCFRYKEDEPPEGKYPESVIMMIARCMKRIPMFRDRDEKIYYITSAKVPIVKFTFGDVEGDISYYNTLGLHNTQLLAAYCKWAPDILPKLGMFIKRWAKKVDIGDAAKGTLSSYAFILLTIHYLQQCEPPVLPVLQELGAEECAEHPHCDKCDVYFYKNVEKGWSKNTLTLAEHFFGFLDYYSNFDWKQMVVQIRRTDPLAKSEKNWNRSMCIEDPFDLTHNLASRITKRMFVFLMRTLLSTRAAFMTDNVRATLASEASNDSTESGKPMANVSEYNTFYDKYLEASLKAARFGDAPYDVTCNYCKEVGHYFEACEKRMAEQKRIAMSRRGGGRGFGHRTANARRESDLESVENGKGSLEQDFYGENGDAEPSSSGQRLRESPYLFDYMPPRSRNKRLAQSSDGAPKLPADLMSIKPLFANSSTAAEPANRRSVNASSSGRPSTTYQQILDSNSHPKSTKLIMTLDGDLQHCDGNESVSNSSTRLGYGRPPSEIFRKQTSSDNKKPTQEGKRHVVRLQIPDESNTSLASIEEAPITRRGKCDKREVSSTKGSKTERRERKLQQQLARDLQESDSSTDTEQPNKEKMTNRERSIMKQIAGMKTQQKKEGVAKAKKEAISSRKSALESDDWEQDLNGQTWTKTYPMSDRTAKKIMTKMNEPHEHSIAEPWAEDAPNGITCSENYRRSRCQRNRNGQLQEDGNRIPHDSTQAVSVDKQQHQGEDSGTTTNSNGAGNAQFKQKRTNGGKHRAFRQTKVKVLHGEE